MCINWRLNQSLLLSLACASQVSAQQNSQPSQTEHRIYLDVVVTPKSGAPVSGLQQQDFTVLDNNVSKNITSFEAILGREARVEVILVLDAVNVKSREAAIEREEISRFLKADGGRLAYPTAVAIVTDKGLQFQEDFSQDGNAISAALSHHNIPVRSIRGDQTPFQAFAQILADERDRPGRKIILWVSPGWSLPVGLRYNRQAERERIQEHVFADIVEVSTQLREDRITLYHVDPSALNDIDPGITEGAVHLRPSDRAVNIEGPSKPSDVRDGDLALEVIATQSGGLALHPGNDLASDLRKCLADAEAYYEISFNAPSAGPLNEYHHLEIRVAKPGLTTRTRQGYYWQPERTTKLSGNSEMPGWDKDGGAHKPSTESAAPANTSDESHSANAPPYLDEPLAQLVARIPELKTLQPALDKQELGAILQKMGRNVDDFVRNVGDLIAHEDVTQEKLNPEGKREAKERVQDNYLILHHGYEWGANAEYRMDDRGNRLGPIGLSQGYLVTSGHALSCIEFSTVAQPQSRFRYLGDARLGSQETYVLAFGQQPGVATFFTTMRGTGGADVDMLTQGILWVDKNNFQILRMRSDLLAPNNEIQLNQLTTDVTFGWVQLQEVGSPLWLPSEVTVYIEIAGHKFRNLHRYTNYRRYRVSSRIVPQ